MTTSPVVSITDELVAELETSVCCVWPESNSAVTTLRALLSERAEMQQQLRAAMISVDNCELFRKDAERMDWLADPDNTIGNVQLPTDCVLQNVHSLRAAIDAAMKLEQKQ